MISVQLQVPARTEGRYGDLLERILAAAERDERERDGIYSPRDPPEDPYHGDRIEWRIESPTTTERRRNRMRFEKSSVLKTMT